jgi:tRNA dimethylallyltransferase
MKEKIIFIVGPTGVGKTEVGVRLAQKINAEIISCDSMQIYKGMDIITSKPSSPLRKKVRHYLIDIVLPTVEYNVSAYRRNALNKIKEVFKRGKTPLFVGGTGLYMSILIDGIFKAKLQNKKIRQRLYEELAEFGRERLYERLKEVDSEAAAKIHPHDARRIIRALEVFESTGKPISYLKRQRVGLGKKYEIAIFCLNMERQALRSRIKERVNKMFARGLVGEVRKLLRLKLSQTASAAIGIKELKGYFEGLYDLQKAKEMIAQNTCQYAKRQLTWFRKDKRIQWIEVESKDSPQAVARRILEKIA